MVRRQVSALLPLSFRCVTFVASDFLNAAAAPGLEAGWSAAPAAVFRRLGPEGWWLELRGASLQLRQSPPRASRRCGALAWWPGRKRRVPVLPLLHLGEVMPSNRR